MSNMQHPPIDSGSASDWCPPSQAARDTTLVLSEVYYSSVSSCASDSEHQATGNVLGYEVVSFSTEDIRVDRLPSHALPGYHVEFHVQFRGASNAALLSKYCLLHLCVYGFIFNTHDSRYTILRPVLTAPLDGLPGVCVSFAPQWGPTDVDSSYITISSITLAGQPVPSPPLPAMVQVGANHAPSEGTRLVDTVKAGNAADVHAALCDGCSTGERDEVRSNRLLSCCTCFA